MIKRGRRAPVDPAQHTRYLRIARALSKAASDLSEVADQGDSYGNAIAITAIHACIAYGDALCIRFAGFMSSETEHLRAVDALKEALGTRLAKDIAKRVQRILAQKDSVSYQGDYYSVEEAKNVVEDLRQVAAFAEKLLT